MDMYFYLTISCLSGGNLLLWFLAVNLLNINSALGKIVSAIIITILGLSSFISFLLVHRRDTKFVRFYYFISASWMGVLLNFILSVVLYYLIITIFNFFNLTTSIFFRQLFLIISTLLLSLYGFYKAYKVKIRQEVVTIKDLPDSWCEKKIVHISDVHLGPIHRHDFFYKIINKIEAMKPDAVFISGDLFDGSESDFSWINKPINDLNAPLGIYYSFGNHDFYLGRERVVSLLGGENIFILDDKMIEKEGLQIIGLNFTPDRNFDLKRFILSKIGYVASKPSLLLFHEPKETSKSRGVGIDLQLSGHTHDGQMFPFNYLAKYFYHNHAHGLFRDNDYSLNVTSGIGTWGPPMRLGTSAEIVLITLRKK